MIDGSVCRDEGATIGETVGRDIDDAHDARPIERETGERLPRRFMLHEKAGDLALISRAFACLGGGKEHRFVARHFHAHDDLGCTRSNVGASRDADEPIRDFIRLE